MMHQSTYLLQSFFQYSILGLLYIQSTITVNICSQLCSCRFNNTLIRCSGKNLEIVPRIPSDAVYLFLEKNNLLSIGNRSFSGLTHVEKLHLQRNRIYMVEEYTFKELPGLQELNLAQNQISHLPRNIFLGNPNLRYLNLFGNRFQAVPDHVVFPLSDLKVLNISYNRLTSPFLGEGFQHTKQMKILDLSGNPLHVIDSYVFQVAVWWDKSVTHSLNLSYCDIVRINLDAFSKLYRLDSLSLTGNSRVNPEELQRTLIELRTSRLVNLEMSHMNISNVHFLFSRFHQKRLTNLDLSFNNIEIIPHKTFYYLSELKVLDISHNKLLTVGDLSELNQLRILKLSHNNMTSIRETEFDGLSRIEFVDLSSNYLQGISDSPFQKLFFIEEINLNGNSITSFSITTGLEHLEILRISNNHLQSLEFLQRLPRLQILDVSVNKIPSLTRNTCLQGQSFILLNFSDNAIKDISDEAFDGCPVPKIDLSHNSMTHLHISHWMGLKELYLRNNNLENIISTDITILKNLEILDISYNQFKDLPPHVFNYTTGLKHLNLGGNQVKGYLERTDTKMVMLKNLTHLYLSELYLSKVPTRFLSGLPNLQYLDLSWNNLTNFNLGSISEIYSLKEITLSHNFISNPSMQMLLKLENINKVDLSYNPYSCTCELMQFKSWIKTHSKHLSRYECKDSYICASPQEWEGVALTDFTVASFSCSHQEKVVILAVVSCALLALLMLVALVIHRMRGRVRKQLRRAHYRSMCDSFTLENPNRHEPIHAI